MAITAEKAILPQTPPEVLTKVKHNGHILTCGWDNEVLMVNEQGQVSCPKCKQNIDYWRETADSEHQERYAKLAVLPRIMNEMLGGLRFRTEMDKLAEQKWQAEKAAIEKITDAFGGKHTWLKLTATLAALIAFLVIVALYAFNKEFAASVNANILPIAIFAMIFTFAAVFIYTRQGNRR